MLAIRKAPSVRPHLQTARATEQDPRKMQHWHLSRKFLKRSKAALLLYCSYCQPHTPPQACPALVPLTSAGGKKKGKDHISSPRWTSFTEAAAARLKGDCFYGSLLQRKLAIQDQCSSLTSVFIFFADTEHTSLENKKLIHKQFQSYRQTSPIRCLLLSAALPVI